MTRHAFSKFRAVTVNHETHTIEQWCELYPERHITVDMVHTRIKSGWTPQKAVTTPRVYERVRKPKIQPEALDIFKPEQSEDEWQFVHWTSRAGEYRRVKTNES